MQKSMWEKVETVQERAGNIKKVIQEDCVLKCLLFKSKIGLIYFDFFFCPYHYFFFIFILYIFAYSIIVLHFILFPLFAMCFSEIKNTYF